MKLKWMLPMFIVPGLVVPIAASPIFNSRIKSNDLETLANAEFPLTIYGWKSFLLESKRQSSSYFQKIQDETLAMSHKPNTGAGETVQDVINFLANHIANSDEFQLYVLYKLREFNGNIAMYNFTGSKELYSLEEPDLENLLAFKFFNQTPTNSSFIIWDQINDVGLPLTNINLRPELRNLIYTTYERVEQIYAADLDRLVGNLFAGSAGFNFSIWSEVDKYQKSTDLAEQKEIYASTIKKYHQVDATIKLLQQDFNKDLTKIFAEQTNDNDVIKTINQKMDNQILHLLTLKKVNLQLALFTMKHDEQWIVSKQLLQQLLSFTDQAILFPLTDKLVNPTNSNQVIEWVVNEDNQASFEWTTFANELINSRIAREFKLLMKNLEPQKG